MPPSGPQEPAVESLVPASIAVVLRELVESAERPRSVPSSVVAPEADSSELAERYSPVESALVSWRLCSCPSACEKGHASGAFSELAVAAAAVVVEQLHSSSTPMQVLPDRVVGHPEEQPWAVDSGV